ncbi:hypothetical protein H9P43_002949 [Blastocladiella emersonii ATCC 22665]|nr:hypothetical protein H9P43_002949 [Blastocladiella emersonii ATCC 22665]
MKVKRQKTCRRLMQLYCSSFNFREPYQLVADGTFVNVALKFRIDIRTLIPTTLAAEVKVFTTPCVINELRQLGEEYMGAVLASKRFESRRCGHAHGTSAHECLRDLIGTDNPHHLMVGTQDKALRAHLRTVPGTPLMYLSSSVLVLEPHSAETLAHVETAEKVKTGPSEIERKRLAHMMTVTSDTAAGAAGVDVSRPAMPARRKAKGPNPLAVQKKKKQPTPPAPTKAAGKKAAKSKEADAAESGNESSSDAPAAGTKRKRDDAEAESAPAPVETESAAAADDAAEADGEADGEGEGPSKKRRRHKNKNQKKKKKLLRELAAEGESGEAAVAAGDDGDA